MNKVAQRLKELREEKGLSMRQLAEGMNIPHNYIGRWETGKYEPSIDSIIMICNFFGCDSDWLIGLKD